jgi:hypothetical protein
MPRIADYCIVVDSAFDLKQSQAKTFAGETAFSMPAGFHAASRSVLFFSLIKPAGATLDLKVHINNPKPLWRGIFGNGDSEFHSVHEVIAPNVLTEAGNTIVFNAIGGSDIDDAHPVRIGDVVILCQVQI